MAGSGDKGSNRILVTAGLAEQGGPQMIIMLFQILFLFHHGGSFQDWEAFHHNTCRFSDRMGFIGDNWLHYFFTSFTERLRK